MLEITPLDYKTLMTDVRRGGRHRAGPVVHSFPEALAGGLLLGEQWHLKQQPATAAAAAAHGGQ